MSSQNEVEQTKRETVLRQMEEESREALADIGAAVAFTTPPESGVYPQGDEAASGYMAYGTLEVEGEAEYVKVDFREAQPRDQVSVELRRIGQLYIDAAERLDDYWVRRGLLAETA